MLKWFVPTILILTSACQKKNEQHRLDWHPGAPIASLEKINQQEWSEKSTETVQHNSKIVLTQQSFLGIPIEGTFLKKLYTKEKDKWVLSQAHSLFYNPPDLKSVRGLGFDENEILRKIKQMRIEFSKISMISSGIVFVDDDHRMQPQFKLSFFDRRGEPWTAFVDQKNRIFKIIREGSHFTEQVSVESHVFPFGPKLSQLTAVIIEKLNLKPTLSNSDVVVTSEADNKILQLDRTIKFEPKDTRFDQVQAFYYLNKSLDWMKRKFALQFSAPLEVVVHVGYPEKTNTAFYFQSKIRLGTGDDQVYSQIPQDPTIVSHESFHYLIDHVASLPYEGEGGSLNEAFADFFTCLLYERPRLAENSYLKAAYKRTLDHDSKFSDRNGGLYHDSLIVSGLLWEISKKVGSEKSTVLAIEILKKMHRFSNFEDFKIALHSEVKKQFSGTELESVIVIIQKRGFDA